MHCVTDPPESFPSESGALEVHIVPSAQDNLIWVLVDVASKEAAVVDGPLAKQALERIESLGARLTTVFNTHTHPDHIGINIDLQRRGLLDGLRVIGCKDRARDIPGLNKGVDEGDEVIFGACTVKVLRTEGHIDGHLSFLVDGLLFCGDTLFAGGCGYLFDGPAEKMHESLQRLAALPESTKVCCAHEYTQDNLRFAYSVEPSNEALRERIREVWEVRAAGGCTLPSTIGLERATNPMMRVDSVELRASLANAWPERSLERAAEVFAATRALKDGKEYRSIDDAQLPLG